RAAELQKKNDLLKEEAIKYQDAFGHTTEELSAGPSRNNPLTELWMKKAELKKQLREARNSCDFYNQAYNKEKAERKHAEDSFRREFQQMQQRGRDAEGRVSELQRKNNL